MFRYFSRLFKRRRRRHGSAQPPSARIIPKKVWARLSGERVLGLVAGDLVAFRA